MPASRPKGFTQVPHDILEKLYSSQFTAKQLRVILMVLRYSTGFHKKTALIPQNMYFEICGIPSKDMKKDGGTFAELESRGVLKKYSRGENGIEYEVNPDTDEWKVPPTIQARGKESNVQRLRRLKRYQSGLASLAATKKKTEKPP